jgi:dTDP-glucose 4,6-dehydratase
MKTIIVTGGAGFIGSNFIRTIVPYLYGVTIINFDSLTYAGNLENLAEIEEAKNYKFHYGDVTQSGIVARAIDLYQPEGVINFAAESHVDRSILGSNPFVNTNVVGTGILLEECRRYIERTGCNDFRFIQIGTDEVYGSLPAPADPDYMPGTYFTEKWALSPNSPYAASKAGADLLVQAYIRTYDFPAIITRSSNNYGMYQFPEKLIPLMITRALNDEKLPVYGDGRNVRDWIHVIDNVEAIWEVYKHGKLGEIYNIGGNAERENLEIVTKILQLLGKSKELVEFVSDRLGHDRRYALSSDKINRELGWSPRVSFEEGLEGTVDWYLSNKDWWDHLLDGSYKALNALYMERNS